MYCRHCGASIPDDSMFCPKCGKSLADAVTTEPENRKVKTVWYYKGDFDKAGPLTQEEIESKICRRQLDFDGDVKAGQDEKWIPLKQSQFAGLIKSLPKETISISDKWIWCLAVIPMVISIVMQVTGILQNISYFQWAIPLALNFLFIKLDFGELINDEINPESWMYMGIILVPVYLLVREIKTNHNFSPAIIWCFLFAVSTFIL